MPTADALQLFSIPTSQLGSVIASLADDNSAFSPIAAIDRVISRATRTPGSLDRGPFAATL